MTRKVYCVRWRNVPRVRYGISVGTDLLRHSTTWRTRSTPQTSQRTRWVIYGHLGQHYCLLQRWVTVYRDPSFRYGSTLSNQIWVQLHCSFPQKIDITTNNILVICYLGVFIRNSFTFVPKTLHRVIKKVIALDYLIEKRIETNFTERHRMFPF